MCLRVCIRSTHCDIFSSECDAARRRTKWTRNNSQVVTWFNTISDSVVVAFSFLDHRVHTAWADTTAIYRHHRHLATSARLCAMHCIIPFVLNVADAAAVAHRNKVTPPIKYFIETDEWRCLRHHSLTHSLSYKQPTRATDTSSTEK